MTIRTASTEKADSKVTFHIFTRCIDSVTHFSVSLNNRWCIFAAKFIRNESNYSRSEGPFSSPRSISRRKTNEMSAECTKTDLLNKALQVRRRLPVQAQPKPNNVK